MSENFPFHLFLDLNQQGTAPLSSTESSDFFPKAKEIAPEINKKSFIEELKKNCPSNIFNSFFKETMEDFQIFDHTVEIIFNSDFILKIVDSTYKNFLEITVKSLFNENFSLVLKNSTQKDKNFEKNESIDFSANFLKPNLGKNIELIPSSDDLEKKVESTVINHFENIMPGRASEGKKTFSNFIVGPSNKVAVSTALSICKNPGKIYPLFFIYGTPGNGKSHLLYAISNKIKELHPKLRTHLTTTRDFMAEVMEAGKNNTIIDLRQKYLQNYDVLLFDDIHILKNKKGTQNSFEYILKELYGKGKQLVFTSLYPPNEIDGLNPQIKSQLSWGLILDIKQPERDHKIEILEKKAFEEDIFIPRDIIIFLVDNLKGNVRDLEGALIRLGAMSSVKEVDIDLEMAKEHLSIHNTTRDKGSHDFILEIVSSFYKIPIPDIKSQVRKKNVARARHVAMYLCHKYLDRTYAEIGAVFNNRDHSTALYSIDKIKREIEEDVDLKNQLFDIEKIITTTH